MSEKDPGNSAVGFQAYLVPVAASQAAKPALLDVMWATALRKWRVIAIWAFAGFALAVGVGFLFTPVYRSSVVLLPRTDDTTQSGTENSLFSKLGALGGLGGLLSSLGSNQGESIAVLESRDLAESFIAEQKIADVLIHRGGWLDSLFSSRSDVSEQSKLTQAYRYFSEHVISIAEDHQTNLVTISIDWDDKALARDWANAYAIHANNVIRKQAIDDAETTLHYVQLQLAKASEVEVRNTLSELAENQLKTLSVAATRRDFAFKVIDTAKYPDRKDKVRPKKAIMGLVGMLLGGLIASVVVYRRRET